MRLRTLLAAVAFAAALSTTTPSRAEDTSGAAPVVAAPTAQPVAVPGPTAPAVAPAAYPVASTAPAATDTTAHLLEQTLIGQAAPYVLKLLLAALMAFLIRLINAHAKNARMAGILTRLAQFTEAIVRQTAQTYVDTLKENGGWNATAAGEAKAKTLAQLRAHLGPVGLVELGTVVGRDNVDAFLGTQIEAKVHEVAAEAAAAPAPININTTSLAPAAV